jgi:hypothetical protein
MLQILQWQIVSCSNLTGLGDMYEGEWLNNAKHGKGTYTFGKENSESG